MKHSGHHARFHAACADASCFEETMNEIGCYSYAIFSSKPGLAHH